MIISFNLDTFESFLGCIEWWWVYLKINQVCHTTNNKFRSTSGKKSEKQTKIPDDFLTPTSPLSISPGNHAPPARKFYQKNFSPFVKNIIYAMSAPKVKFFVAFFPTFDYKLLFILTLKYERVESFKTKILDYSKTQTCVKLLWKLCDFLIFDGLFRERGAGAAASTSKEKFAEFRQKLSLIEILFFQHISWQKYIKSTMCLH